jgi:hypothetical protein
MKICGKLEEASINVLSRPLSLYHYQCVTSKYGYNLYVCCYL